jgi:mannosyltransferase
MPDGLTELTYPALSSPDRVDWVDYAERNRAADPEGIAKELQDRAGGHAIFVVWMSDYRTLGDQCERLLAALGPTEALVQQDNSKYFEPAFLHRAPPVG